MVTQHTASVPNYVPIFLSNLNCMSPQTAILDCTIRAPIGITKCQHSNDVYVRCQGRCLLLVSHIGVTQFVFDSSILHDGG